MVKIIYSTVKNLKWKIYRVQKSLKMSTNQIFRNKLPIYENVGDERDQNVYISSKLLLILKFHPSIWFICSINV